MDTLVRTAYRILRTNGASALWRQTRRYLGEMTRAVRFIAARHPADGPAGALVDYAMATHGGLIRPGQVPSEITTLLDLVQALRPRSLVEIGTANGGTFFLWCAVAHPEATAISIDLPGGLHGGGYRYWRTFIYRSFARPAQQIHLLRADSHAIATRDNVQRLLGNRKVDFLFIDGDHTYDGVATDFRHFAGLVRQGGIIAFHDICPHPPALNCQVDVFWNEVKGRFRHTEIVEDRQQGWGGIGVLFVDDPQDVDERERRRS